MNKPHCEPIEDAQSISDLFKWLQEKAGQYELKYLLAHAEDGVIWGDFRGKNFQLITSGDDDVFPQLAKLRLCTLQQCRIFGQNAEVMLWKIGQDNWKARLIKDDNNPKRLEPLDESQILWGTQKEEEKNGFTLVSDGSQGLKHGVPLMNISFSQDKNKLHRPIRLKVRHYIDYDDSGVARIYLSRLVDLTTKEEEND
ncbi:MAG TPA: TIGR03984 family CRISPR-associated protein [Flavobacterium sp.]|nr:TIGR03984 family CRISPR-associated protein [Flavobacterium sp.]